MIRVFSFWIILFFVISLFFSECNSNHDGADKIGFPFVFFQRTSGWCLDCDEQNFFKVSYLFLDLVTYAIFAYLFAAIWYFLRVKKKRES